MAYGESAARSELKKTGRGNPGRPGKDAPAENPAEIILAGRKQLTELLTHRPQAVREILLVRDARLPAELLPLIEAERGRGKPVRVLDPERFQERVRLPVHQKVAAVIAPKEPLSWEGFCGEIARRGKSAVILVLDQVSDPQNLGALLRVADCAGAAGVVITSDRSAPLSAASRRTSLGASEFVPLTVVTNLHRALEQLKELGFWIVGTDLQQGAKGLFESELPLPAAIVLGSEGEGMRALTRKSCDLVVHIPLFGRLESLNVSHAAVVVLYELLRQEKIVIRGEKQ